MGKLTNFIKDQDWFGHPILLSFNKKGNSHNTAIGGCLSIICKSTIIAYFAILLKKMVNYEDDKILITNMAIDYEELGRVNQKDMSFIIFVGLLNARNFF